MQISSQICRTHLLTLRACRQMDAAVELEALRADNARLGELLASKDQMITYLITSKAELVACKDELPASRAAELQRCMALLQHSTSTPASDALAPDSSKRQRLQESSALPLDRDDILDHVFKLVGGADHLYVGGVSRRWRGTYLRHCAQNSCFDFDKKLVTRHRSVLMTKRRLQLALSSGLTVTDWNVDTPQKADLFCKHSLEPEKVMTLLRVHGVPWSIDLCTRAAFYNKLTLLQCSHSNSCPWHVPAVLVQASKGGSVAVLEWLLTVTAPWPCAAKLNMLHAAACHSKIPAAQWLRANGATWPRSFPIVQTSAEGSMKTFWKLPAVKWALACDSGWLTWNCENYAADRFKYLKFKQQAKELLDWAHAYGCPCTCGHVQQQQQ
jgi:hypothetical protein